MVIATQRKLLARVAEWDVLRYSETKLSKGRTRRSPSERTATALAGEQGEARRGRRRDAGQWGLWSISVFGRHCFGFGRCGSIKKATFPHADTSESQRAEAANACLKIHQLQPDKCCEGGGMVLPRTTVRRSNLDPAASVHRIRYDGESISRSARHSGTYLHKYWCSFFTATCQRLECH